MAGLPVAIPLWAWSKVDKVDAFPEAGRPDDQPGTTYLMVGSDSRGDLTAEERKELGTGNASGNRTDTIMLLHTGDGPNLLMSIPRDSLVEIPGYGSGQKINAAYAYGGAKLLVRTIEGETGIRVDHFVEVGFGGFVDLVDAVGGIEVCPPFPMDDPQANIKLEKGCQEVDGPDALGYARSRKTDEQFGDLGRAQRQREVVSAIGSEAVSPWSVINPVRYYRLNMAGARAVRVSEGTSPFAMVQWAIAMTRVDGDSGLTCGVPVADFAVNWDEERSEQMFGFIREDDTESIPESLCTPTGLPEAVTAQRWSLIRFALPSDRSSACGASTSTRAVTPIRFLTRSASAAAELVGAAGVGVGRRLDPHGELVEVARPGQHAQVVRARAPRR